MKQLKARSQKSIKLVNRYFKDRPTSRRQEMVDMIESGKFLRPQVQWVILKFREGANEPTDWIKCCVTTKRKAEKMFQDYLKCIRNAPMEGVLTRALILPGPDGSETVVT
jgi:hypothetical protein